MFKLFEKKSKKIKSKYKADLEGINLVLKTIHEINNSKTQKNVLQNYKKNKEDINEIIEKTLTLNNKKIEELD